MSESKARWPPKIGDHVQIVATGASGVVMDGNDARRFRVAIYSHESGTVTAPPPDLHPQRALPRNGAAGDGSPSAGTTPATGKVAPSASAAGSFLEHCKRVQSWWAYLQIASSQCFVAGRTSSDLDTPLFVMAAVPT